jgi:hypothetical protein
VEASHSLPFGVAVCRLPLPPLWNPGGTYAACGMRCPTPSSSSPRPRLVLVAVAPSKGPFSVPPLDGRWQLAGPPSGVDCGVSRGVAGSICY